MHEIVAFVRRKRSWPGVGSILVLFVAPLSARGLCFMPVAAAPSSTSQAEHDCCKQGLQALPPACCMTSLGVEAPARIAKRHRPCAPIVTVGVLDPRPVAGGAMQRRRLLRSHGGLHLADPPPLVLRI